MEELAAAVGVYPHTAALFDRPLHVGDAVVAFKDLSAATGTSVRSARILGFDLWEMPIVSYFVAREHGASLTALPVFVTRQFDHRRLVVNLTAGIEEPRDLEGRRVGCRYWGFTDATWARGVLSETFGVDLDAISWVTSEAETVAEAVLPPMVTRLPGADLAEMLVAGELAGYTLNTRQVIDSPVVGPLLADPDTSEREWFETTGVLPIHHVVVVRDEVLAAHPEIAIDVPEAFERAKKPLLVRLASSGEPGEGDREVADLCRIVGPDPYPQGIEANAAALEMLVRMCREQHLLTRTPTIGSLFAL